jgi:hypothetical protein
MHNTESKVVKIVSMLATFILFAVFVELVNRGIIPYFKDNKRAIQIEKDRLKFTAEVTQHIQLTAFSTCNPVYDTCTNPVITFSVFNGLDEKVYITNIPHATAPYNYYNNCSPGYPNEGMFLEPGESTEFVCTLDKTNDAWRRYYTPPDWIETYILEVRSPALLTKYDFSGGFPTYVRCARTE